MINDPLYIESRNNPKFKRLRSLQKTRNRKKEGRFLMEGRPELDIALKMGHQPELVAYCEEYISLAELSDLDNDLPSNLLRLNKSMFDDLSYQHVAGNFLAVFPSWETYLNDLDVSKPLLILENVEKPGNLGAILRTCDAFGVEQLVCTETAIDLFNPNVLRNSRGALFNVNCVFCDNVQLEKFLTRSTYRVFCAALHEQAISYKSIEKTEPFALALGAESVGLSDFWLDNEGFQKVIIPMRGVGDSLNVSVSAAVLLSSLIDR